MSGTASEFPIALLVPDGVGVRNFILSHFLREACPRSTFDVFHVIPENALSAIRRECGESVRWHELVPYRQNAATLILQNTVSYAQMYWADTQAMRRLRRTPARGSWKMRALTHCTRTLGLCGSGPARMRVLDLLHYAAADRQTEVNYYREIFRKQRQGVLFSTHQRPSTVVPAVLAARSLGIPTATFIFSWDNITSKGRIAAPFDHYLVWSGHMRDELLQYYPSILADNIHIVGTPQFAPYSDKSLLWSREEFFRRIGADISRPLICYSGGDAGTCPEDQEHVRVLMEFIRAGHITGRPQVIVRPVPVDDGSRYAKTCQAFPELIFAQPQWNQSIPGDWSRILPTKEDIQFLANLTQHADLNVNLGSTMTLDFGLRDKPVVNVAFDVASPPLFGMPVWDYYYSFEHYRPVVEFSAARFARTPEQMVQHINAYLADPSLDRDGRKKLAELEIGVPPAQSNQKIMSVLREIARPS